MPFDNTEMPVHAWQDTPADYLRAAKSLITDENCWTKYQMEDKEGRRCSVSALDFTMKLNLGFTPDTMKEARRLLNDLCSSRIYGNYTYFIQCIDYNNVSLDVRKISIVNDILSHKGIMHIWDAAIAKAENN